MKRAINIPRRRRFPARPIVLPYIGSDWTAYYWRDNDELERNVRIYSVRVTGYSVSCKTPGVMPDITPVLVQP